MESGSNSKTKLDESNLLEMLYDYTDTNPFDSSTRKSLFILPNSKITYLLPQRDNIQAELLTIFFRMKELGYVSIERIGIVQPNLPDLDPCYNIYLTDFGYNTLCAYEKLLEL